MGRGWGAFVHSPREISARYRAAAVLAVEFNPASLVKSCGFERPIDVAPHTADSLGDFHRAHPFLAQGEDAGAIESGGAALVDAACLRGVDPVACRSRIKPSSAIRVRMSGRGSPKLLRIGHWPPAA
jgi:hypothetical protein